MSITEDWYYEQNRKGFEGDTILKEFVENIIKENGIKKVLEGGTYLGSTTKLFSEMVDRVDTIEIRKDYYDTAEEYLKDYKNIILFHGSTLDIMPELLKKYADDKYLFFCDSHWGSHNPLLEELGIIANAGHKPYIIIHDFKVDNHPELGYDSYNGQDYEWDWIKESIENIYGKNGYKKEYNSEAAGAKRGIIFVYPKSYKI